MGKFSQLYISSMLFYSGGHSLYEFTAPLSLKDVRKEFKSIEDFDKIGLKSMFFTDNDIAVESALQDASSYNKSILLEGTITQPNKRRYKNYTKKQE